MTTRKYSSRSQQTTLTSAVTSGASIIPVVSATTLLGGATVSAGQTFTAVIDPDTALEEIVEITVVSSNNLTVNRAVDMAGAAAQDHSSGAVIRHMIIGRDLREANLHIEATGAYNDGTGTHAMHGLGSSDGVVVGTTATQTLTNKTLTAPILTGAGVDASIVFEGTTADAHETTLTVVDPTQDNEITLPNTSGTVAILTATQTMTNKTLTSPTISGSPVITGLSSAGMSASSAAPKSYVDAILVLQEASAASSAVSAASSAASATAAATSATSAAASATAAATSATSAAASATTASASVASIATYASNALASQTAAATSATSAAASATAAATSATSAAASATTASNSASTATTQAAAAVTSANSAATSATSAAASATTAAASVASIATYASNALTSQTAAATSATSAETSATAAATSASSAATSASSAATSASDAATTYDNFDDRYLGSKSTAPSVDNDGNTLLVGAIYWNDVLNNMYVWSGSVWVQIATTSIYTAPTLGSTTIGSGATVSTITALTLSGGLTTANPSTALGIANKQYVDEVAEGLRIKPSVRAATTTNLAANYYNGPADDGVGATLTADTNRAFNTLDGVTSWAVTSPPMGVLIKNQTNKAQNGRYNLTTLGDGSTPWVLTRCGLCDESDEIPGSYSFVQDGTVNEGTGWVQIVDDPDTFVVGTDDINVYQFSGSTYTAGDGLTLTGTTFSIATDYTNDIYINAIMGAI